MLGGRWRVLRRGGLRQKDDASVSGQLSVKTFDGDLTTVWQPFDFRRLMCLSLHRAE